MRRKAVIRTQPVTRRPSVAELAGRDHFHFCRDRDCRLIYEDRCADPAQNGRCRVCLGLRRPVWDGDRDPQPCCLGNCSLVTDKDALIRHQLAGPGPWFQCGTCARAHGWPCTLT